MTHRHRSNGALGPTADAPPALPHSLSEGVLLVAAAFAEQSVDVLAAEPLGCELQRTRHVTAPWASGTAGEQGAGKELAGAVGLAARADGVVLADGAGGLLEGAGEIVGKGGPVAVLRAGISRILDRRCMRPAHDWRLRPQGRGSQMRVVGYFETWPAKRALAVFACTVMALPHVDPSANLM